MSLNQKQSSNRNLIVLPVIINGNNQYNIIVDIGASITTLDIDEVNKLGIKVLEEETMDAITAHGIMKHKIGIVDELKFNNISFQQHKVRIGNHKLKQYFAKEDRIIGVLGHDIFKNFILEISYGEHPSANFLREYTNNLDQFIDFQYIKNFLVSVTLNINNRFNLPFILDTGASGSLLNRSNIEKFGLQEEEEKILVASPMGQSEASLVKINKLNFPFGIFFSNIKLVSFDLDHLKDDKLDELGGLIGFNCLNGKKLIIDYPKQKIFIQIIN